MPEALRIIINWRVLIGIITGIGSTIMMFNQLGAMEGYWLAHRDWVRHYVMDVGGPVGEQLAALADLQYGTQITVLEESLKQTRREKVDIEIQLQDDLESGTRRLLSERLAEIETGLRTGEERVRVLRCALEPGSAWCK